MKARDPRNPEEWQEAVNAAEYLLLLDSARQYGLIVGGAKVNQDRAVEILEKGRQLGYHPLRHEQLVGMYL